MKLVSNWRRVLSRAWSAYGLYLLAGLSGLEIAFAVFMDAPPISRGLFAALYALVTSLTVIARITEQRSLHDHDEE